MSTSNQPSCFYFCPERDIHQWHLQIESKFDVVSKKPIAGFVAVDIPELRIQQVFTGQLLPGEGTIALLINISKVSITSVACGEFASAWKSVYHIGAYWKPCQQTQSRQTLTDFIPRFQRHFNPSVEFKGLVEKELGLFQVVSSCYCGCLGKYSLT